MPTSNISPCQPPKTNTDKSWPYIEYYLGEKDEDQRKNGYGTHHWSGAQSLATYSGRLLRDTMHGIGEYRSRYRGETHQADTYEGHFYNNCMHGYGLTSYANGRVFSGLYFNNVRWGPGIESYARLRENVGLWRGCQLVRLTWKPDTPSVAPDLMSTPEGRDLVARQRHLLVSTKRIVGKTNPALELLKQYGAEPLSAAQNWIKLYPKNCTDPKSQLFHSDVFERAYYGNEIETLEPYEDEMKSKSQSEAQISNSALDQNEQELFYTWNNNDITEHMMQHSYQHCKQFLKTNVAVSAILNGPRSSYKPAAEHELDCRTFLMACYLGHLKNVAQLINENDVNPNVTDIQGNSALMYAACGNQPNVIHFLVEAGAQINNYNDGCCTPLGAALINYVCAELDVHPSDISKAIIPVVGATVSVVTEKLISEWKIDRNITSAVAVTKKDTESKPAKNVPAPSTVGKRSRSLPSVNSKTFKSINVIGPADSKTETRVKPSDLFTEDSRLYLNISHEFEIRVNDIFTKIAVVPPVNYIFDVNDMVLEINTEIEEQKKVPDKKETKKDSSKIMKDLKKPSVIASLVLEQSTSMDSKIKVKIEQTEQLKATITQLLLDGADPRRVRCPQPALFLALVAHAPDLVEALVKSGANVNEVYPEVMDYTPLDIAVSQPFTYQNLEVIRTLLESGASPKHLLPMIVSDTDSDPNEPGPTLLHAVLAKRSEDGVTEEIRLQVLELLLKYGCDPIAQYKGRSSMDVAMSKSLDIFDTFIESPHTNLNAAINESKQNILLKMFFLPYCRTIGVGERLQMLTNLLLFGADPLLKCQHEEEVYDNLFVFAKANLVELDKPKAASPTAAKQDSKKPKNDVKDKSKNIPTASTKSVTGGKGIGADEVGDYKQALSLVTECARLLIIRWIQAELLKELIVIVDRFKHRHWNMILKEYKNSKRLGLWLNPTRCLEIWDILKTTKKRIYNDKKVLRHLLCIVLYYFKKIKRSLKSIPLSSDDKASIESEAAQFVRENQLVTKVGQVLKRPYVTPELTPLSEVNKFNVCFECAIPVKDEKIPCNMCKLVEFCSFDCMRINVQRYNCHPCSNYLKKKYFPSPEFSDIDINHPENAI